MLSLTLYICLYSFSCCWFPNLWNPTKSWKNFERTYSTGTSRSSNVIDLGANRKCICDWVL